MTTKPAQFIGAGTIADLARCEEIQSVHLAKVLQYRPKLMLSEEDLWLCLGKMMFNDQIRTRIK
jgi:hypothetical protein